VTFSSEFIKRIKFLFLGEQPSQYDYVEWWMKEVVHDADRLDQDMGVVLMTKLPQQMVAVLPDTSFDPTKLTKSVEIYHWLDKHIYFGKDGVPMVLHDKGRLVWAGRRFNESAWLSHKRYYYG
jgi:hypothetical protein